MSIIVSHTASTLRRAQGDTFGVVSLNKDELLGVIMESPTFARTMKAVFDLAWLGATAFVAK